jgi:hypothetical protein
MRDSYYREIAPRSMYILLESMTKIPEEYLKQYEHVYEDGHQSMLSLVNEIEDYHDIDPRTRLKVLEKLSDGYVKLKTGPYRCDEILGDPLFSENIDMSTFFKKVISSVYPDGVEGIIPKPSKENRYLWSNDDRAFAGEFTDGVRRFSFRIREEHQGKGDWAIDYKFLSLLE